MSILINFFMHIVDASVLTQLYRLSKKSHKGENGRVLIIAGSDKYHGSMLLTVQTTSRIVDMVYVHSVAKNLKLIDKLKSATAVFVNIDENELASTAKKVDVIIIGPGIEFSQKNIELLEMILRRFSDKKILLDATAFDCLNLDSLHKNCIITPNAAEFERVFKKPAIPQNALGISQQYNCIVVLKGQNDYISDGNIIYENQTGNAGMTKGGMGDVLAGLIGGLLAKNDKMVAAQAGAYINGLAGDRLYEKKSAFYNAEDLVNEIGEIWKEKMK